MKGCDVRCARSDLLENQVTAAQDVVDTAGVSVSQLNTIRGKSRS